MSSEPSSPHASPSLNRELLERLNFAISAARMGIWDWNVPADCMTWDAQTAEHFGMEPGNFDGRFRTFLACVHPEERERVEKEIGEAVARCAEYDGEFRVVRPADGSVHFLRMRFRGEQDAGGKKTARVTGVCWDVTERRQTESKLMTKRHLLNTLMDYLPDHIYFKDRQSRFIAVNKAMAGRRGIGKPEDMIGKNDFDFFSDEHARAAFEDERRVMETGEPLVGHVEKETWPDGGVTWVSTTKLPLRDDAGNIIGTFGLSRDVTERKRAEVQLAKFTEELRSKNELLEGDLEMARELQSALLPQKYPCFPHTATASDTAVRFFHFYNPSMAVSGDFFDVLDLSDTMAGIFVCDVMGHGVRAALVAAIVRALVSELKLLWSNPAEFLTQLNHTLRSTLEHAQMPIFASAFYAVVDLTRGELRYANAGHPMPLLVHHFADASDTASGAGEGKGEGNQRVPHSLNGAKPGPALGLFADAHYTNCRQMLTPHDVLLLFTDGLFEVEGQGGQLYDYQRLLRAVSRRSEMRTEDLCREVVSEVQEFSASKEFSDDVCLVAVEVDHLVREEAVSA